MSFSKEPTWFNYLVSLREKGVDTNLKNRDFSQLLFSVQPNVPPMFKHFIPITYLLDYTSGKYHFFSDDSFHVLGFKAHHYKEGGIDFTISNYHKDDLKVFNEKIFPDRINFIRTIDPQHQKNYVFSHNYRLRKPDGSYASLLQRNSFVESDKNGNPILSLGMMINVEYYKKPDTVLQIIEKIPENDTGVSGEPVFKKLYFLNEEDAVFTKREREILKFMSDGLSSKLIAEKLFLSEHTVIVHRKNMLSKTGSSNVAQLISWAIRNEII